MFNMTPKIRGYNSRASHMSARGPVRAPEIKCVEEVKKYIG